MSFPTLLTDDPGLDGAFAQILVRRGTAFERAADARVTQVAVEWLAEASRLPAKVRVGPLISVLELRGQPPAVRAGLLAIAERHAQTPAMTELEPPRPDPVGIVGTMLRRRFGRQGYGLAAEPAWVVGAKDSPPRSVVNLLRGLGADDVVVTGVNLDLPSRWWDLPPREPLALPPTSGPLPLPALISRPHRLALSVVTDGSALELYAGLCLMSAASSVLPGHGGDDRGATSVEELRLAGAGRHLCWSVGHDAVPPADLPALADDVDHAIAVLIARGPSDRGREFARQVIERVDTDLSPINQVTRAAHALLLPEVEWSPLSGELPAPTPSPRPEDFRAALARVLSSALVLAPDGTALHRRFAAASPVTSAGPSTPEPAGRRPRSPGRYPGSRPVAGLFPRQGRYQPRPIAAYQRLSLTGDGIRWSISVPGADGRPTDRRRWRSIPADEVAVVHAFADGERDVYPLDGGAAIRVDPLLWRDGPELVATIDRDYAEVLSRTHARSAPDDAIIAAVRRGRFAVPVLLVMCVLSLVLVLLPVGALAEGYTPEPNDAAPMIVVALLGIGSMPVWILGLRRLMRWRARLRGTGIDPLRRD